MQPGPVRVVGDGQLDGAVRRQRHGCRSPLSVLAAAPSSAARGRSASYIAAACRSLLATRLYVLATPILCLSL
jgi:hypothetical protein